MGKQGPCYHCGVTSTPLWRNGPPEKPVLCNACGSRWRTKGTLVNYTPLHARVDPDYEDHRVSRVKSLSIHKNKESKSLIRIANNDVVGSVVPDYNQGYENFLDEDNSNRSSSGSAISNPESCAQFCSMDMNELTGPYRSDVWDSIVPSKKRTCVGRTKPSAVEKLTKDLFTIMQEQQISCSSGSSEEELIFEPATPMVLVEIGHGGVLIRHPSLILQDDESEASSLTVENKHCPVNKAYSHFTNYSSQESKSMSSCKDAKPKNTTGYQMQQRQLNKDQKEHEELNILANPNSPLCNIDLSEILNFEVFSSQLSNDEQQQLLKYLPLVDIIDVPNSLEKMFGSCQFKENECSFKKGLAEGVFDLSLSETKTEDCRTLKKLILSNLSTSQWAEHYHRSKGWQINIGKCHDKMETSTAEPTNSVNLKRSRNSLVQNVTEVKTMRSPKMMTTKAMYEAKERTDSDNSCFSPRKPLVLPTEHLVINPLNFVEQSSEQYVLLDIPSNGSFPQAELLTDY